MIENCKKKYSVFPKDELEANLANIALVYNIDKKNYDNLQSAVKQYLIANLCAFYGEKFVYDDCFLDKNFDRILNLPNISKNGALYPKKDVVNEFQLVQQAVNELIINLAIAPHIDRMMNVTVRVKGRQFYQQSVDIPYLTEKFHSDAWVGHQGDAVCMAGILGDVDNSTVEYYEPLGCVDDFLMFAESFDETVNRYKDLKYLGQMTKKKFVVMDHACVHRTLIKPNAKPRVSIDFGLIVKSDYSYCRKSPIIDRWKESYFSMREFFLLGKTKKLVIDETLVECQRKFSDNAVPMTQPNRGIKFCNI